MKKFFSRIFGFIKTYPPILYSLFLIVFLPLLIYGNVFFAVSKFQRNIDLVLQKKALFVQNVISLFVKEISREPEKLQPKIENLVSQNPEIRFLRILKKEGENFVVVNSFKREELGAILEDPILVLSWSQNQSIATLISSQEGERLWKVVSPVFNEKNEKIGLISLALSLKETDELIEKSIFNSFLVSIFGICLSLFLIFHHTNLFGYVILSKKLKEMDRAKDEFIRMATHELQSPIVNITAYISDLKERIKNKLLKDEIEDFKRVEISAKNLSDLIEDILVVSRIQQAKLDFTPQKLNLKEELKEAFLQFESKAREKNLKFYFKEPKENVFVFANKLRLQQVLANLISNAIKYTFSGYVKLAINVDELKKKCYIVVEDTGVGISAEAQKKLFQKFFREKKRETAEVPGTGLGLFISKEIVEKMGGEIFVESIEGKGSRFIVCLPLYYLKK